MKRPRSESKSASRATGVERRVNRSAELGQALKYQLDACRAEGRLDAMLVADDWGLCVAESGARGGEAELAACLPPAARSGFAAVSSRLPRDAAKTMDLQRLVIGSSQLFVCAVGGRPEKRAASLRRVEAGFRRILAASGS